MRKKVEMKFQAVAWNMPYKLSTLGLYLSTGFFLRGILARRMSFNTREDSLMAFWYKKVKASPVTGREAP
jgi:hypothetical protein